MRHAFPSLGCELYICVCVCVCVCAREREREREREDRMKNEIVMFCYSFIRNKILFSKNEVYMQLRVKKHETFIFHFNLNLFT